MSAAPAPGHAALDAAPPALRAALAGKQPDFVARAGRAVSRYQTASILVLVLLAIVLGATIALDARGPEGASWSTLAIYAAFVVLLGLTVARFVAEARAGAAWWAGTEEALVRVRGEEVRTIPWSEFRSVVATRAGTRGTVYLVPKPAFVVGPLGRSVSALEGPVRLPGRMGLTLLDVDDSRAIEQACRARVAAAKGAA